MKELFKETVLEINKNNYSGNQFSDWTSCGESETRCEAKLTKINYFVCEGKNKIVGFCALNGTNIINSIFVSKDCQEQSIGNKMMRKTIHGASTVRIKKLKSEVSITAKLFF